MDERITSRSDGGRNDWMFRVKPQTAKRGKYYAQNGDVLLDVRVGVAKLSPTRVRISVEYLDGNHREKPGFILTIEGRHCHIGYINKSKTHSGTQNLQAAEEIARMYGASSTTLLDRSMIMIHPKRWVSLRFFHIMRNGKTWYESHGYRPDLENETEYRANVDALRNTKMENVFHELGFNASTTMRAYLMRIIDEYHFKDDVEFLFTVKGEEEDAPWVEWMNMTLNWLEGLDLVIDLDAINPKNVGKFIEGRTETYGVEMGNIVTTVHVKMPYSLITIEVGTVLRIEYHNLKIATVTLFNPTYDMDRGRLRSLAKEICRIHGIQRLCLDSSYPMAQLRSILRDGGLKTGAGMGRLLPPDGATALQIWSAIDKLLVVPMGKVFHIMPLQPNETLATYMVRLFEVDKYAYGRMEHLVLHRDVHYSWSRYWKAIMREVDEQYEKLLGVD